LRRLDRSLIRRATLHLIGLAPTPSKSVGPAAGIAAIERWGRHWLNLVRYAEDDVRSLGPESVLYALPQDARY
jgi:hypothetical protein